MNSKHTLCYLRTAERAIKRAHDTLLDFIRDYEKDGKDNCPGWAFVHGEIVAFVDFSHNYLDEFAACHEKETEY